MSIQSANNLLDIILLLGLKGADEEDMLDLIYQTMDRWMREGHVDYCAHVLRRVVRENLVSELPVLGLLALASITLVSRHEIGEARVVYIERVRAHLTAVDPERVDELLRGLA